ncbi:hypothetical protein F5Y13DRAFT_188892 [Hypoxylon sp. FL1857]|nr:hypothetical protein F5Y13DRAFT_188892 [Hypoxylon sp. FL1857]
MASKGTADQGVQLTAREVEILGKVWQCFDEQPKINWQKLAEVASFKNAATARACFTPIKRKLAAASGEQAPAEAGEATAVAKGRGKRKAEVPKTPDTSKKTKTSAAVLALNLSDTDDDDPEDFKPRVVNKKTGPRKKGQSSSSRKTVAPVSFEDSDSDAANAKAKASIKAEETEDRMLDDEA